MVKKVGTGAADRLVGTALADELRGAGGNDVLLGLAGNDFMLGGTGNDTLSCGTGDDRALGGAGNDKLRGEAGKDRLFGDDGDDVLTGGTDDDVLNGGKGLDSLLGQAGNDTLKGGLGNDRMDGGTGADIIDGGDGDDVLHPGADLDADQIIGGAGIDTVSYVAASAGVTAYLAANVSGGAAQGDTYNTVENVVGSRFGDFLQSALDGNAFGGDGNDTLFGAFGQNTLRGDLGADTLRMDYGNSRAWVQLDKGTDTIQYFVEDGDKLFIDLSEFGLGTTFDGAEIVNSNAVTAVGTNAQFIYEDDATSLWFDSNGTGAGGVTLIAVFTNATINNANLGTNDFDFQL